MVCGDPHAHHSAKRMAEEDHWFRHSSSKKFDNVFGILRNAIASRHMRGLAVSAQVGSINMPSRGEVGNQRQKNLPASAQPVQQNESRSGVRCFSVIDFDLSDIEELFAYAGAGVVPDRRNHLASPDFEYSLRALT